MGGSWRFGRTQEQNTNHRRNWRGSPEGMGALTGGEDGTEARDCRGPMVEAESSGGGLRQRCSASGATVAERSGRLRGKRGDWGRRRRDRSDPLFMGSSGTVPRLSRPQSLKSWVGSGCAESDTWLHAEQFSQPHRGPHKPNGSASDRVRIPAREPEQRRIKSRRTRVSFCYDKTPGGTPWQRNFCQAQEARCGLLCPDPGRSRDSLLPRIDLPGRTDFGRKRCR